MSNISPSILGRLLIVPCGIETALRLLEELVQLLLIVPCGIETCNNHWDSKPFTLLIVPCGIETLKGSLSILFSTALLIVPCGIETRSDRAPCAGVPAFNRTLWN